MAQQFVVTFGGSGARCAEALLYLAASRTILAPLDVLVVDPDQTNWNVAQAVAQLRRYQAIQSCLAASSDGAETPFFSTAVNEGLGSDSFFWANPQPHTPFSTLIEYASLQHNEQDLLNLLYDESDLELTFEKGYIGRAHVGSLDLLRALRAHVEAAARPEIGGLERSDALQQFFRRLREATQRPGGARLLVIGSVFGGTGASGLPAIPPMLRQSLLGGLQEELTIGCVQLAHYFSFPQGRPEDPDSALHPLATQAALYHYALTDAGYDRVYLLGAPDREHANQRNVPGGEGQKNRPHYAELGAALAAAHYFEDASPTTRNREVYATAAEEVNWEKLPSANAKIVQQNIVAFTTVCMLHARFLTKALDARKHAGAAWERRMRKAGIPMLGGQEPELHELRDFAERYLAWAIDVQRYSGVELFTFDGAIRGETLGRVVGKAALDEPYHELMLRLNKVGQTGQHSAVGWYVAALSKAAREFCEANYPAWWR